MSENLLATVLTLAILAGIVLWVPLLQLVCPRCSRFFKRRQRRLPVGRPTTYTSSKRAA